MRPIVLSLLLAALAGCASKTMTEQAILIGTTPPGAGCTVLREGQIVGRIDVTPGTLLVDRNKHDLTIKCQKPGYQPAETIDKSGLNPAAIGIALGGGLMAAALVSAQGTDNDYTTDVELSLPAVPK
jgi:hypothetical protein